jgi:hypothetical protein
MRKQPNGTGKKPPAPSVNIRPRDFHALVEILKGRRPQRTDDAEPGAVPSVHVAAGDRVLDDAPL